MKKFTLAILVSVFMLSVAFAPAAHTVFAIESEAVVAENTDALCHDGNDNDDNLLTDASDPACAIFFAVLAVENTDMLCHDGNDNDDNMLVDASDPACAAFFTAPAVENTDMLCHDGIDNNDNMLVDASDPACSAFFPAPAAENTDALCHDDLDNDDNMLVDASDPACAAFFTPAPAAENTDALCHDDLDNDDNMLVDASDPACAAFFQPTPTSTTPTTPSNEGTGTGNTGGQQTGGGGFTSFVSTGGPSSSTGTVLGASTDDAASCSISFLQYMKRGQKGPQIVALQAFLNTEMGLKIPLTGYFGAQTEAAVRAFQVKYAADILAPWANVGKLPNQNTSTGYVYKTTLRKMNLIRCATLNIPQIAPADLK